MKIAIVEDDINYRKSLETAFEDYAEYEVVSFKNPKDALKSSMRVLSLSSLILICLKWTA